MVVLLYVGISPGPPPRNGKAPSSQNLYRRIRDHYTGNAEGSSLRLTLGCHLADQLGIALRRVGSGTRLTFTPEGEAALSAWMAEHARVAILEHPAPWEIEPTLINAVRVPLNIDHNAAHPYYPLNRALRAEPKAAARACRSGRLAETTRPEPCSKSPAKRLGGSNGQPRPAGRHEVLKPLRRYRRLPCPESPPETTDPTFAAFGRRSVVLRIPPAARIAAPSRPALRCLRPAFRRLRSCFRNSGCSRSLAGWNTRARPVKPSPTQGLPSYLW